MIKVIHTTQGLKRIATEEVTADMTLADALTVVGFEIPAADTAVKVRRDGNRMEITSDQPVKDGDVISLAKSADGGLIKVIHTTQGLKKIATEEVTADMTLADALTAVGFEIPAADTAVKVRRNGDRLEITPDQSVKDGDVVSLAKSADGGK